MESALIISNVEKATAFLSETLTSVGVTNIRLACDVVEAKKALAEVEFDLVLINAPIGDESGESLAKAIAQKLASQVILIVREEVFDTACKACEGDGVLTVAKPINKTALNSALSLARAAQNRLKRFQSENQRLKQKIDDIKITDRAKLILISVLKMSEQDAHRYIEKHAMDMRESKRSIAEGIIRTYEN